MKKSVMLAICVAGLSVTLAAPAFAQDSDCSTDADCQSGWSCEEVGGYETCSSSPDGGEPVCEATPEFACVPPPPAMCDPALNSSDCDSDDVCVTFTYESCASSGGGSVEPSGTDSGEDGAPPRCDGGEDGERCGDDPPDEGSCDTQTDSYCVPAYIAPCSVDADCGSGFTCEDVVECEPCAVDVGTPGDTDGDTDGGDEVGGSDGGSDGGGSCDDSCAPTGQKYCEIVEVECSSDADCGAGFECAIYDAPTTTDSTCPVDPDDPDAPCDESGGGGDDPEPAPTTGYCAPEGWESWGGGYDEDGATSGGGSTNAPGGPGQGWDLSDAEAARADGSSSNQSVEGDSSESLGCTTTRHAAPTGGGLGLLAMLAGLVGARTRRRRD